jgi:hypothetical protein
MIVSAARVAVHPDPEYGDHQVITVTTSMKGTSGQSRNAQPTRSPFEKPSRSTRSNTS